jgi:uncharacterized protein YdaU (DUF1376 family)
MSAPQWFPLYPTDFLTSTATMTPAQGWAYTQLLMFQWTNGSVPDDRVACARLTRCDLTEADWEVLRARFQAFKGSMVNLRLEREREAVQRRSEMAAESGKRGAQRRWGNRTLDGNPNRVPNGNPNGDPIRVPNGNPNGETMATTTTTTQTPHLTVGGSRGEGEGNSSAGNRAKPAASTAGRLEGAEPRPSRQDGPTPTPTPANAPEGIVARSAISRMRSPTADEMARITRRPGNSRLNDETIAAKKSVIEKILTAKGVSPELRVAVWEAGIREWSHTGTDPYEWCKGTVLADWVGVRNPNAIISHRLGIALDPVAAGR